MLYERQLLDRPKTAPNDAPTKVNAVRADGVAALGPEWHRWPALKHQAAAGTAAAGAFLGR
jgi:hypothetical protein